MNTNKLHITKERKISMDKLWSYLIAAFPSTFLKDYGCVGESIYIFWVQELQRFSPRQIDCACKNISLLKDSQNRAQIYPPSLPQIVDLIQKSWVEYLGYLCLDDSFSFFEKSLKQAKTNYKSVIDFLDKFHLAIYQELKKTTQIREYRVFSLDKKNFYYKKAYEKMIQTHFMLKKENQKLQNQQALD